MEFTNQSFKFQKASKKFSVRDKRIFYALFFISIIIVLITLSSYTNFFDKLTIEDMGVSSPIGYKEYDTENFSIWYPEKEWLVSNYETSTILSRFSSESNEFPSSIIIREEDPNSEKLQLVKAKKCNEIFNLPDYNYTLFNQNSNVQSVYKFLNGNESCRVKIERKESTLTALGIEYLIYNDNKAYSINTLTFNNTSVSDKADIIARTFLIK